ncbi:hypothetical protein M1M34_gp059 [Haloarcula tailed virus 2]|uniref:Uncharacterized protein n=1 Tax=Haloarcula tailed virus 2 TaxID=2877989 RepID=A0AAE9BYU2_9CAUD|nr:hypothetical protein M1M34_gp059 [Haloarcula tailed virus 2]UBF23274.1 hypothetical protein HATV-2_gp123 [Haloarcula tailed virus 2]
MRAEWWRSDANRCIARFAADSFVRGFCCSRTYESHPNEKPVRNEYSGLRIDCRLLTDVQPSLSVFVSINVDRDR